MFEHVSKYAVHVTCLMFDSDSKRREERMQVAGGYNINIIFNFKIFNVN